MRLLTRFPLHPLLLAAYAVLFLYGANLDEVLLVDAVAPLSRSVIGAAAVWIVSSLILRSATRGALVASAVVVAFFAFGHVASFLADVRIGYRLQLAGWATLVLAVTIYAARAGATLRRTTTALNTVAAVLVAIVLVSIVPYEMNRGARASAAGAGATGEPAEIVDAPDIYYLVFDRYGSADAIERRFGITDNDLDDWLEGRGFQVPVVSRAAYRATDFSLAANLNMRYLDDLTEQYGRDATDRTPARQLLQGHEVGRFLKARGYRYYHLGSWFGATASSEIADVTLSFDTTSEFESVLRDTTMLPAFDRLLDVRTARITFRDRHREAALFQLRQLHRVATAPGPKFVVAHVLLPHDPYVLKADGSLLSDAESRSVDEAALYRGHLTYLNGRIKEIVEDLLSGPAGDDPIIIIQADEGPLMCRSIDCPSMDPEYFATRFGILNAIYLPGSELELPSTFTAVNTFRLLFREYFSADLEPLPDRSFTWPDNDHIYDFVDVTDQIPDPLP